MEEVKEIANESREVKNLLKDRSEQFETLRFLPSEAKRLARLRDTDGNYLRVGQVARVLEQGCPHKLVFRIFAPLPEKFDPAIGLPDKEYTDIVDAREWDHGVNGHTPGLQPGIEGSTPSGSTAGTARKPSRP